MITNFLQWFENETQQMIDRQAKHPASAAVISSGKQPQVNLRGDVPNVNQPTDEDRLLAIDSHIKSMYQVILDFEPHSKKGLNAKKRVMQFCKSWDELLHQTNDAENAKGLGDTPNPRQIS